VTIFIIYHHPKIDQFCNGENLISAETHSFYNLLFTFTFVSQLTLKHIPMKITLAIALFLAPAAATKLSAKPASLGLAQQPTIDSTLQGLGVPPLPKGAPNTPAAAVDAGIKQLQGLGQALQDNKRDLVRAFDDG